MRGVVGKILAATVLSNVVITNPALASDVSATPAPNLTADVSPSGAWALSIVFPGLGQVVLGDPLRGKGIAAGSLGIPVMTTLVAIIVGPSVYRSHMPGDDRGSAAGLAFSAVWISAIATGVFLWVVQIPDAIRMDRARQRREKFGEQRPEDG